MTTIAQVVDAIQQINGSVRGMKFAPSSDKIPTQLNDGQLPAAITWYADDDWCRGGQTHFVIEVYVAPVGPTIPAQAMQSCLTIAQAFRDTYRAITAIDTFPVIRQGGRGGFGSDGIHRTMGYSGKEFFGFSLRVPIMGIQ